jgi:hypothetical protein
MLILPVVHLATGHHLDFLIIWYHLLLTSWTASLLGRLTSTSFTSRTASLLGRLTSTSITSRTASLLGRLTSRLLLCTASNLNKKYFCLVNRLLPLRTHCGCRLTSRFSRIFIIHFTKCQPICLQKYIILLLTYRIDV